MDFKQFYTHTILFEDNQVAEWNKYIEGNPELKAGVEILETLVKKGYKAYIVGGAVRDLVLGLEPKDIDISTNCPIDVLAEIYNIHDIGKSRDFGIVTVRHNNFDFEIAQFRQESYVKPKSVQRILNN